MHLQYLGFPVLNDPLYNHVVFGPHKGKGGAIGKSDDQLIQDLIAIHNAENWLGMDGDSELSMFNKEGGGGGGGGSGGGGPAAPTSMANTAQSPPPPPVAATAQSASDVKAQEADRLVNGDSGAGAGAGTTEGSVPNGEHSNAKVRYMYYILVHVRFLAHVF